MALDRRSYEEKRDDVRVEPWGDGLRCSAGCVTTRMHDRQAPHDPARH